MTSREYLRYLLLCGWLLAGTAQADESYARIVAFGDSLSDPGNAFIILSSQEPPLPEEEIVALPPYQVIPGAPYLLEGRGLGELSNFSNGPTWIQQLSVNLELPSAAGPAFADPVTYSNYAIGGTRARKMDGSPSLAEQVDAFIQDTGGAANRDALYTLTVGGNDLRDVTLNPADAGSIIRAAVRAIHRNLALLAYAGARDFLVADLPNLAVVPAVTLQDDRRARFEALLASLIFNAALRTELERIDALPGVRVGIIEAFRLTTEVAIGRSEDLDFDAGTAPCLRFFVADIDEAICGAPHEHFYWDGIHPTRAGHAAIAQRALEELTAGYHESVFALPAH